jgi:dUTPase
MNHSAADCRVQTGDRIAQMIIENIDMSDAMEVDSLQQTERGTQALEVRICQLEEHQ